MNNNSDEKFRAASSILNNVVKPSVKSSGRSNPPPDDSSDPSSSSSDSDSDSDAIITKKKKPSKKHHKKKKSKNRKNKNKDAAPFLLSPPSSSDSDSSSSDSSDSDSESSLDSKSIGGEIYANLTISSNAHRHVLDLDWNSERNSNEATTLAQAADAMARNRHREAFEIICRRLAGVIWADRTGDWARSSALEWKNNNNIPLSHKTLKFFDKRAKAFITNNNNSRSNRKVRQFANAGRSGGGRMFNRNNQNNNNSSASATASFVGRPNTFPRPANTGRGGSSNTTTGSPSH